MNFQDFVYTYFISPINTGSGFNPINTVTYALFFVILAYGIFEVFKKLKINIDKKLVVAFLPFILFGISVRIFEDAGIIHGFWFVTPGIWVLFSGIMFSAFLLSMFIERKTKFPYYKTMSAVGLILFLPTLLIIQFKNLLGFVYVLLFYLPLLFVLKFVKWRNENKIITAIHGFDAIVTSISIYFFNYRELHVLPNFVINLTGTPFSFIILKLAVIVPVLVLLDKYTADKEFKNFIKLVIGLLGFVPGVRDFVNLMWLG